MAQLAQQFRPSKAEQRQSGKISRGHNKAAMTDMGGMRDSTSKARSPTAAAGRRRMSAGMTIDLTVRFKGHRPSPSPCLVMESLCPERTVVL